MYTCHLFTSFVPRSIKKSLCTWKVSFAPVERGRQGKAGVNFDALA